MGAETLGELINRRRRGIAGLVSMVLGAACLVWALPGNAGAQEQEPPPTPSSSVVEGNEDCGDLGDFAFEFKIEVSGELPEEGTFTDEETGFVVTISDVHVDGGTAFFSFESNIAVSAVFVKAGPGGILYTFEPPSTIGIDLASPKDSISHISFCWNPPPPTTTSTTEAPTTSSTEAPTTSSTEAPTTSSTEAPTTSSTEAPTTSSTEAPTTSSTEATTTTVVAPSTTTTTMAVAAVGELPKTGGGSQPLLIAAGIIMLLGGGALLGSVKLSERRIA
jgi:LPXTG-motif cell wall-anchored protein